MAINHQELARAAAAGAAAVAAYPPAMSNQQRLADEEKQLRDFWANQLRIIEQANNLRNHQLPIARIKRIMKAEENVCMISTEAPILVGKACEVFIGELALRSWFQTLANRKKTIQRSDVAAAIASCNIYDFLVDIVPREDGAVGGGPAAVLPPIAPHPGVIIGGGPAVDPAAAFFVPPFQIDGAFNAAAPGGGTGGGGAQPNN